MTELVTVEQAEVVLRALIWAGPLAGLLIGAGVGAVQRAPAPGACRGLAVGALGPIVYVMWLLYSYLVRYNPETGRAGLHSVAVLALSALIFIVVGASLGGFYRRVVFPTREPEADEEAPEAPDSESKEQ